MNLIFSLFDIFKIQVEYAKEENLQRFRHILFHYMLVSSFFLGSLTSFFVFLDFIPFDPFYSKILLFNNFVTFISIYLLNTNKSYYLNLVIIFLFLYFIMFILSLFLILNDEFRLVWFFLISFATFILLGKKAGIALTSIIILSILSIYVNYDLHLSSLAIYTFILSLVIFSIFAYSFLRKIENDAQEFNLINQLLQERIEQEVSERGEQEQMLLQQYRLASMGEMIDSIAHQWRQPLMNINAIIMNMDRNIEQNPQKDNFLETKLEDIANLTAHMSQTIEDFRYLLADKKNSQTFLLSHAISEVRTLLKSNLQTIAVEYYEEQAISISTNKSELLQALIILLNNAVEALSQNSIQSKYIYISLYHNKGDICIDIEDNAGGINPDNLNKIFDPYFTTKKQLGGTGLGLYIAKLIIEHNLHAQLTAINSTRGAKFQIRFPHKA